MQSNETRSVGDRIRQIRAVANQQEFADRAGVSLSTLRRYEGNERLPDAEFLIKLNELHGIQPLWVLTGKGPISGEEATAHGDSFDAELMTFVIHATLQACYQRDIKPNPEAFARMVIGVYEISKENGSMPPQNAIERLSGALD